MVLKMSFFPLCLLIACKVDTAFLHFLTFSSYFSVRILDFTNEEINTQKVKRIWSKIAILIFLCYQEENCHEGSTFKNFSETTLTLACVWPHLPGSPHFNGDRHWCFCVGGRFWSSALVLFVVYDLLCMPFSPVLIPASFIVKWLLFKTSTVGIHKVINSRQPPNVYWDCCKDNYLSILLRHITSGIPGMEPFGRVI